MRPSTETWRKGDAVTLDLKMLAERLYAHPNVRMDVGRAALRRGPLIYCVEEADNPGGPVQTLALPRSAPLDAAWKPDLFGGAMILKASAKRLVPGEEPGALYSTEPPATRDASARRPALSSVGQSQARLDGGVGGGT